MYNKHFKESKKFLLNKYRVEWQKKNGKISTMAGGTYSLDIEDNNWGFF